MKECIIHGDHISGWNALYVKLSSDLSFPSWFGCNLDALYDCLTDLQDSQITIYHWSALSSVLGQKAAALRSVLTDAGMNNPRLTVCILDEDADEI